MMKNNSKDIDRSELVKKQIKTGLFANAISTAKSIDDKPTRSEALATIAKRQAESGDKEGAQSTFEEAISTAMQIYSDDACSIYNEDPRSKAMANIAEKQANAGMFTEAISTAMQIYLLSDVFFEDAFHIIVESQLEKDLFTDAVSTTMQLENDYERERAIPIIVQKLLKRGRYTDAITLAKNINDEWDRMILLESIKREQKKELEMEKFDRSISEIQKEIKLLETQVKSNLLTDIKNQADSELTNHGIPKTSNSKIINTQELQKMVAKLFEAGLFEDAISLVQQIDDDFIRLRSLQSILSFQHIVLLLLKQIEDESSGAYTFCAHMLAQGIPDEYEGHPLNIRNGLVKKIYLKAEMLAEKCGDYSYLGSSVARPFSLCDEVWARKLFMKAEKLANSFEDYRDLGVTVGDKSLLGDENWEQRLYSKALDKSPNRRYCLQGFESQDENETSDWVTTKSGDRIYADEDISEFLNPDDDDYVP